MKMCRMRLKAHILAVCSILVLTQACICHPTAKQTHHLDAALRQAKEYYANWIGVPAPDFGVTVRDRIHGLEVDLANLNGKRVLLYSFEAGDFVNAPKEDALLQELKALNTALAKSVGTNVAIVSFTYGAMFFLSEPPPCIQELARFPVVNLTSIGRDLCQPYRVLCMPSAIVVDGNGIIIDVFLGPMTASRFTKAVQEPDWSKPTRPIPQMASPDMATIIPREMPTWGLYVFRQDLSAGTEFKREYARRTAVYDQEDVPPDAVRKLKEIEGQILKCRVTEGCPVRKSYFVDK